MFSPKRLSELRERAGYTRSRLHEELILAGTRRSRSLLDRWEQGRSEPRATELWSVARVLEVPVAAFFVEVAP